MRRLQELIAVIIIMAMVIGCMVYESKYTREATVIAVAEDSYEVTVEDESGFIWTFDGSLFTPGDKVILYMNSMGSIDYIEDDVIEKVEIRK